MVLLCCRTMKAMCFQLISVVLNSMSLLTYFTEPFGNEMRKNEMFSPSADENIQVGHRPLVSLVIHLCNRYLHFFRSYNIFACKKHVVFIYNPSNDSFGWNCDSGEPGSKRRVNTTSLPIQKRVQVKIRRVGSCVFFSRASPLIDLERCLKMPGSWAVANEKINHNAISR